jgi:hypothetical protein
MKNMFKPFDRCAPFKSPFGVFNARLNEARTLQTSETGLNGLNDLNGWNVFSVTGRCSQ